MIFDINRHWKRIEYGSTAIFFQRNSYFGYKLYLDKSEAYQNRQLQLIYNMFNLAPNVLSKLYTANIHLDIIEDEEIKDWIVFGLPSRIAKLPNPSIRVYIYATEVVESYKGSSVSDGFKSRVTSIANAYGLIVDHPETFSLYNIGRKLGKPILIDFGSMSFMRVC